MEHNIRYATEDDFGGRLTYRLPDKTDQEFGFGPTPELWDLNAITYSISTLRKTFEWLEHSGVYIPTVYSLTGDGEANPPQSWQDQLQRIAASVYHLDSIVGELLSEERRPTMDSVCCG
jgi:hypothetical protein